MSEWTVGKGESGESLLSFLAAKHPQFSKRRLKAALERNGCSVNGQIERFATHTLAAGDRVVFTPPQELPSPPKKLPILFEDPYFVIYDKPSGVASEKLSPRFLVHRLDKGTSGAILFAKSKKAKEAAEGLFRRRAVKKSYFALVDGAMREREGVVENYLACKRRYAGQSLWGAVEKGRGAYAKTAWKKVKEGRGATFVRCRPFTGRTHQIRVHLSGLGHPILGDGQYGRRFRSPLHAPRLMLHAAELEFTHPFNEERVAASSPLPDDFRQLLERL